MDADQDTLENPFGMDPDCRNCPALCESRERVVHGYGDVAAEFLVVGETPSGVAETTSVPFADGPVFDAIDRLGLLDRSGDDPVPDNVFLTHLTRCRNPERPPTDDEIGNCEPYLNGEIRMINPEIIVPVGERVLRALAFETPPGRPRSSTWRPTTLPRSGVGGSNSSPSAPTPTGPPSRRSWRRCPNGWTTTTARRRVDGVDNRRIAVPAPRRPSGGPPPAIPGLGPRLRPLPEAFPAVSMR